MAETVNARIHVSEDLPSRREKAPYVLIDALCGAIPSMLYAVAIPLVAASASAVQVVELMAIVGVFVACLLSVASGVSAFFRAYRVPILACLIAVCLAGIVFIVPAREGGELHAFSRQRGIQCVFRLDRQWANSSDVDRICRVGGRAGGCFVVDVLARAHLWRGVACGSALWRVFYAFEHGRGCARLFSRHNRVAASVPLFAAPLFETYYFLLRGSYRARSRFEFHRYGRCFGSL